MVSVCRLAVLGQRHDVRTRKHGTVVSPKMTVTLIREWNSSWNLDERWNRFDNLRDWSSLLHRLCVGTMGTDLVLLCYNMLYLTTNIATRFLCNHYLFSNAINLVVLEVDHPVSFVVQPILPQRDRHEQLPSRPFPFMSISPLKIIPSSSRRSRMWARGPFSWWSMGHFHPQAMAALGMSNRFLRAKNASSSPVSFSTLLYYGREEFLPYPLIALFTGASMSLLDALLRKMLFYKKHQWPAVLTLLPRSRSNVQYLNEYSFFHSQKNNAYRTVPVRENNNNRRRTTNWNVIDFEAKILHTTRDFSL